MRASRLEWPDEEKRSVREAVNNAVAATAAPCVVALLLTEMVMVRAVEGAVGRGRGGVYTADMSM